MKLSSYINETQYLSEMRAELGHLPKLFPQPRRRRREATRVPPGCPERCGMLKVILAFAPPHPRHALWRENTELQN
ncbi:hypothetical protein CDAR_438931 [Caerostris darwini]|uniref:Uncharacterized protein n=1 Tax=Caerostris darwini TaxID=1538125 RepID=A0AAV4X4Y8_9ARAC|nr:hypothetical protein CDAR_438931 [Caerostris darwini]